MDGKEACRLICTDVGANLQPVVLIDQQTVILGRCPATGILDKKLSRQQVEAKADVKGRVLHVKQLGSRPSVVAGKPLQKDQQATIKDGDRFQLVTEKYEYQVLFPAPESTAAEGRDRAPGNSSSSRTKQEAAVACESNSKQVKGGITDFFKKATKKSITEEDPAAETKNHPVKKARVDLPKKATSKRTYHGAVSDSGDESDEVVCESHSKQAQGGIKEFFKKATKRPISEDDPAAETKNHPVKKLRVDLPKKATSKRTYHGAISDSGDESDEVPSKKKAKVVPNISQQKRHHGAVSDSDDSENDHGKPFSAKATHKRSYHGAVSDSEEEDDCPRSKTSNAVSRQTLDVSAEKVMSKNSAIGDNDEGNDDGKGGQSKGRTSHTAQAKKITSQQNYRGAVSDSDDDDGDDTESLAVKAKLAALQEKARRYQEKQAAKKQPDLASSLDVAAAKSEATPTSSAGVETQLGMPAGDSTWEDHGKLVVYTNQGVRASNKIVGLDLDGTIITTKSGKVFPTSLDDWRINYPEVPAKLKKLRSDGYKVVIFTNQLGILRGKLKLSDFKRKLLGVQSKVGVPFQALIAMGEGICRKPAPGMWTHLCDHSNDGIKVDKDSSLFIGDAAGRPADWMPGKKKDFSCSDRLFALNIGLTFYTPEEFFVGQKKNRFHLPVFDPRKLSSSGPLLTPSSAQIPAQGHSKEVVVLVGSPASGKSTFVKKHLLPHKYIHINRDTMGSWQKCVAATESALAKGQSVVVDNTNPDPESRQRYTACAKKAGVHCRCFVFNTSFEHARHNEKFRQMTDAGKGHATINEMVFHSYKKKYVEPTTAEGFDAVVKVNFLPSFSSAKEESLYRMFLLEK